MILETGDALIGDLCQNGWGFGMGMGRFAIPLADLPEALPSSWEREGAERLWPGHGQPFPVESLRTLRLS